MGGHLAAEPARPDLEDTRNLSHSGDSAPTVLRCRVACGDHVACGISEGPRGSYSQPRCRWNIAPRELATLLAALCLRQTHGFARHPCLRMSTHDRGTCMHMPPCHPVTGVHVCGQHTCLQRTVVCFVLVHDQVVWLMCLL